MAPRTRLLNYAANNLNFGIYYDKIYTNAYLPNRIRYNQVFFYAILGLGTQQFLSRKNGNGQFCPNELSNDMSTRRYYSSDRPITNIIARQWNSSAAAAHVKK